MAGRRALRYVYRVPRDYDENEITRPGTPDALRTMREMQDTLGQVLVRLGHVCDALDRIEKAQRESARTVRQAKDAADRAIAEARQATHTARFGEKRIDALVARLQAVENGQR